MCCSIDTRISRLTQSPSKFKISATYFVVFFNTSNIAFIEAQTRNSICGSNGLLSQDFYMVNRASAEDLIEPKSPHSTSHQRQTAQGWLGDNPVLWQLLHKRTSCRNPWRKRAYHLMVASWSQTLIPTWVMDISEQLVDALDLVPCMSDNKVEKEVWLCCACLLWSRVEQLASKYALTSRPNCKHAFCLFDHLFDQFSCVCKQPCIFAV